MTRTTTIAILLLVAFYSLTTVAEVARASEVIGTLSSDGSALMPQQTEPQETRADVRATVSQRDDNTLSGSVVGGRQDTSVASAVTAGRQLFNGSEWVALAVLLSSFAVLGGAGYWLYVAHR